jgi:hypothetical protein
MTPQDLPKLAHFTDGVDLRVDLRAWKAADAGDHDEDTPAEVRRFVRRALAAAEEAGGPRAA